MGEPARKYELFDADPVDADAFLAPPAPRRRAQRRAAAPESPPRRRQPSRGEPEPRGRAAPQRTPTRRDEAERRRARPQDPPDRRDRPRRAERSRAEQSRAERSRAERSRAERAGAARTREDATFVAPPAPVAAPRTPFVLLVLILVSAGIVGLLVLNTEINQNSYRLEKMRQSQAALDIREQQLSSQLADRQSPGNLAAAARRLGLVPADDPAFLRLPDGRVLSMPGPGTPTGR